MSPRSSLLALASLLTAATAPGQGSSPLRALDPISSIQTLSRASFEGKGLYGYINGGAELYHEYGFVRLEVRTVRVGVETLSVEGFLMRDPVAALGILSVSRGGCSADTASLPFTFLSRSQLQAARDSLFIRIVTANGGELSAAGARRILRIIEGAMDRPTLDARGLFGGGPPPGDPASVLLVRGPLGLQNGWDEWSGLFEGIEGYEAALSAAEEGSVRVTAGAVRFRNRADLDTLRQRWSASPGSEVRRLSRMKGDRLLLLECAGDGPLAERGKRWFNE